MGPSQTVAPTTIVQVKWYGGECAFGEDGEQQLRLTIRRQLEWCFSDANLCTDQLLHDKICEALPGGWLPFHWLVSVRRALVPFCAPAQLILQALEGSHLEVCMARRDRRQGMDLLRCLFLRRRQPLPPLLKMDGRKITGCMSSMPLDPEKRVLRDPCGTLNRLKDQARVQSQLQVREVGDNTTIFFERQPHTEMPGAILAVGYERVLYGDDGPYIELNSRQVKWDAWPHFHSKQDYENSYYDEYYTDASHSAWCAKWDQWDPHPNEGLLMLYAQIHAVNDRPWAPKAVQRPHAPRPRGYADYRPGYYYITADATLIRTAPPVGRLGAPRHQQSLSEHEGPAQDRSELGGPETSAAAELLEPSPSEEAASPSSSAFHLCWDFQAGVCRRGDRCKWRHA